MPIQRTDVQITKNTHMCPEEPIQPAGIIALPVQRPASKYKVPLSQRNTLHSANCIRCGFMEPELREDNLHEHLVARVELSHLTFATFA